MDGEDWFTVREKGTYSWALEDIGKEKAE